MKTAAPAPEENQPSRFWWWLGIGASVIGVAAFGAVIAVAALAELFRADDGDVHPGLVKVPFPASDFRSFDERRGS